MAMPVTTKPCTIPWPRILCVGRKNAALKRLKDQAEFQRTHLKTQFDQQVSHCGRVVTETRLLRPCKQAVPQRHVSGPPPRSFRRYRFWCKRTGRSSDVWFVRVQ